MQFDILCTYPVRVIPGRYQQRTINAPLKRLKVDQSTTLYDLQLKIAMLGIFDYVPVPNPNDLHARAIEIRCHGHIFSNGKAIFKKHLISESNMAEHLLAVRLFSRYL